ncbi:energy-coupled thiamine transporter ThiT [Ruoffia sp. FAM 26255]|uniref:energy-coupled thiamine transporter ThiT n=1 Tax=Ruoffia sp. FAM 26255 TaxID=3259519 RepID=UPI0038854CF9
MNQRTRSMLLDSLYAIVLGLILAVAAQYVSSFIPGDYSGLAMLPLIWLALRYGSPLAIISALLTGLIVGFTRQEFTDWLSVLLEKALLLLSVGFAGLFAKYTQKTLNNRRYSSTYLNIFTGALLSTASYMFIKFWLTPLALDEISLLQINGWEFWLSLVVVWLIIGLVILIMARSNPKLIIPKRTKYLSRKETSSLLND